MSAKNIQVVKVVSPLTSHAKFLYGLNRVHGTTTHHFASGPVNYFILGNYDFSADKIELDEVAEEFCTIETLTEMEQHTLNEMVEHVTCSDELLCTEDWAHRVGIPVRKFKGVIASLSKKGLLDVQDLFGTGVPLVTLYA